MFCRCNQQININHCGKEKGSGTQGINSEYIKMNPSILVGMLDTYIKVKHLWQHQNISCALVDVEIDLRLISDRYISFFCGKQSNFRQNALIGE